MYLSNSDGDVKFSAEYNFLCSNMEEYRTQYESESVINWHPEGLLETFGKSDNFGFQSLFGIWQAFVAMHVASEWTVSFIA